MKITKNFEITAKKDGTIITKINGVEKTEVDDARIADISMIYSNCRGLDDNAREAWLNEHIANGEFKSLFGDTPVSTNEYTAPEITPMEKLYDGIQSLMDFFKEFEFEPNFRFINTLAHKLEKSKAEAKAYIANYFELVDSSYKNEVVAKIGCREFSAILDNISAVAPTKTVNQRFKIYYGSQGTGKTTLAQTETENRCIVCNASMLPSDLMEDFGFKNGDATFNHSMLRDCMENGKALVLDEINLLPFDSLRFLQGILDGKKEFNYKNETVHINDGFMIIGTMNLSVNGMVYGLPEPLVDRCFEMKKFNLDAKTLMGAIC